MRRSYSGTMVFQLSVMIGPFSWMPSGGWLSGLGLRAGALLDAPVMLARELAPFGDHDVGAVEIFAVPAILLGIEPLHRLARDHVLVVELVDDHVLPDDLG